MKQVYVSREFTKNPSEITREEFIKMAIEDVEVAKVGYRKWSEEEAEKRYEEDTKRHREMLDQKMLDIINASYKKYKREYYRARWVASEIAKLPCRFIGRGYWHTPKDLSSIRWDLKPWDNATSYIDLDRDLEYVFGYLYDEAIKNKYFLRCTGWSIVEDFHTEFKFHLSEEVQAEWKADEKKLADAINRFYAGSNYWGD